MFRIEHNVATGEVIEIALTESEIKEIEKLQKESAKKNAAEKADRDAKAAQRQALLERLGITEEEARILLGGN